MSVQVAPNPQLVDPFIVSLSLIVSSRRTSFVSVLTSLFKSDIMARHLRFVARTVFVKNGDVDAAYRTLNNSLTRENIVEEVKRRRYYEKPFQKRRRLEYEEMRSIYNKEMARRIKFLMRKNRDDPWPVGPVLDWLNRTGPTWELRRRDQGYSCTSGPVLDWLNRIGPTGSSAVVITDTPVPDWLSRTGPTWELRRRDLGYSCARYALPLDLTRVLRLAFRLHEQESVPRLYGNFDASQSMSKREEPGNLSHYVEIGFTPTCIAYWYNVDYTVVCLIRGVPLEFLGLIVEFSCQSRWTEHFATFYPFSAVPCQATCKPATHTLYTPSSPKATVSHITSFNNSYSFCIVQCMSQCEGSKFGIIRIIPVRRVQGLACPSAILQGSLPLALTGHSWREALQQQSEEGEGQVRNLGSGNGSFGGSRGISLHGNFTSRCSIGTGTELKGAPVVSGGISRQPDMIHPQIGQMVATRGPSWKLADSECCFAQFSCRAVVQSNNLHTSQPFSWERVATELTRIILTSVGWGRQMAVRRAEMGTIGTCLPREPSSEQKEEANLNGVHHPVHSGMGPSMSQLIS
ncbi:28S ribosomal protein S21, mitochondrial [Holothuria leucospilota]|uniref:28S ribosomal protein S21, mitochondrial n=1 Tax=Holothuria leucospilota TaxID=206669 RepID=A0A9Q1CR95_HOLLE|nr:28S ribosomal protein S21, mitochondrial [Holothuria leucospilota]